MAQQRITKRTVDAIHPGAADLFIWDDLLKGFGLKVTPAGSKTYIAQYRTGGRGSPTKRVTIGKHGPLTPEQARGEALKIMAAVETGQDPAALRAAERRAATLADFAERYIRDYAEAHKRPRSVAEDRRNLKLHILPALGRLKLGDIDKATLARFHAAGKERMVNANRCLALLSHLFAVAERWGDRAEGTNPCRHVEKYPEIRRERFLTSAELARLGDVLREAEASGSEHSSVPAAIRLLILTGARLSEVLTLRWDAIDFDRGVARLAESKTGAKTLPLGAPALDLLARLPRIEGNPHVLPGDKAGAHLVALQRPWRRLRHRAELDGVRLHDLRHGFASTAVAGGDSLFIIGKMLGHSQAQTTERYAHLQSDPIRQAADRTAGRLAEALDGKTGGADAGNVVPLKRA